MVKPLEQVPGFVPSSPSIITQKPFEAPEVPADSGGVPTPTPAPRGSQTGPELTPEVSTGGIPAVTAPVPTPTERPQEVSSALSVDTQRLQVDATPPPQVDLGVLRGLLGEDFMSKTKEAPDSTIDAVTFASTPLTREQLDARAQERPAGPQSRGVLRKLIAEGSKQKGTNQGRIETAVVPRPEEAPRTQAGKDGLPAFQRLRHADRAIGVRPELLSVIQRAEGYLPSNFELQVGYQGGTRTLEEQKKLLAKGVTKTLNSRHLAGNAIDLQPIVDGKNRFDSHDMAYWGPVRDAMKKAASELGVAVEWGGDWKGSWDKPHWQLAKK